MTEYVLVCAEWIRLTQNHMLSYDSRAMIQRIKKNVFVILNLPILNKSTPVLYMPSSMAADIPQIVYFSNAVAA